MSSLHGKVVVVTGAARGQGEVEARLAADAGAVVVLTDVLDEAGSRVAAEIGAGYEHLDVSSPPDWARVVGAVVARYGRIDGLVNNAAVHRDHTVLGGDVETWDVMIAVNETGTYLGVSAVAPDHV